MSRQSRQPATALGDSCPPCTSMAGSSGSRLACTISGRDQIRLEDEKSEDCKSEEEYDEDDLLKDYKETADEELPVPAGDVDLDGEAQGWQAQIEFE